MPPDDVDLSDLIAILESSAADFAADTERRNLATADLQRQLSAASLVRTPVPGDGSCMLASVAVSLERATDAGTPANAADLRAMACNVILDRVGYFAPYMTGTVSDVLHYADRMSADKVWADGFMLVALAELTRRTINVWLPHGTVQSFRPSQGTGLHPEQHLSVVYNGVDHYDAIVPVPPAGCSGVPQPSSPAPTVAVLPPAGCSGVPPSSSPVPPVTAVPSEGCSGVPLSSSPLPPVAAVPSAGCSGVPPPSSPLPPVAAVSPSSHVPSVPASSHTNGTAANATPTVAPSTPKLTDEQRSCVAANRALALQRRAKRAALSQVPSHVTASPTHRRRLSDASTSSYATSYSCSSTSSPDRHKVEAPMLSVYTTNQHIPIFDIWYIPDSTHM